MVMQALMKVCTKTSGKINREEEISTNMARTSIREIIKGTIMSNREAIQNMKKRDKAEEKSDTTTEAPKIEDPMKTTEVRISSSNFIIEIRRARIKILLR